MIPMVAVHRPLIQATLPEGQVPERAPDFTIRQNNGRFDGQRNGNNRHRGRDRRGASPDSGNPRRVCRQSGHGSGHGQRHGNRPSPSGGGGGQRGGGRPAGQVAEVRDADRSAADDKPVSIP
jgi:hypothetical protein